MKGIDEFVVHGSNWAAGLHVAFNKMTVIDQENANESGSIDKVDSGVVCFSLW